MIEERPPIVLETIWFVISSFVCLIALLICIAGFFVGGWFLIIPLYIFWQDECYDEWIKKRDARRAFKQASSLHPVAH